MDTYFAYSPAVVSKLIVDSVPGSRVVKPSNAGLGANNLGMAAIGHMAVKPFALLHRMHELPLGEVLLFVDANVFKHPDLLFGFDSVAETAPAFCPFGRLDQMLRMR